MKLRVATYNTLHCSNWKQTIIDFEGIAGVIRTLDADVVGLNEIRGAGPGPNYDAQTEKLAELAGYPYYYFAPAALFPAGPYGNAVLSRIPFESVEVFPIAVPEVPKYDGYYEPRCVIKVKLANGVTVMISHFGLNPDEQERAVEIVLNNIDSERTVLMGDFNMEPDAPELQPLRKLLVDSLSYRNETVLSFPSDEPYCKIDYIYVTKDVKVREADVPAIVMSDHRPHYADLTFKD